MPGKDSCEGNGGVGPEHDEVAVRHVGEAHHAEHQRQTEREQRVQTAQQQALKHCVDHVSRRSTPR